MANLAQHVQKLPRELYDKMLDLTFTPTRFYDDRLGRLLEIDWLYKAPVVLQVSKGTRRVFARRYYSGNNFVVVDWNSTDTTLKCRKWLLSLSREHRAMLLYVKCRCIISNAIAGGLRSSKAEQAGLGLTWYLQIMEDDITKRMRQASIPLHTYAPHFELVWFDETCKSYV